MAEILQSDLTVGSANKKIVLASASPTRAFLLKAAGVPYTVKPSRVDEQEFKISMGADGASPVEIAEVLAEAKAISVSQKIPDKIVLGADQVLAFRDTIFNKPVNRADALKQLQELRGHEHELISYAVIAEAGRRIWHASSNAKLTIRADVTDEFLNEYLNTASADILNGPGAYKVESLGVQLFSDISGSHYTILGLPLLALLDFLRVKGILMI